MPTMSNPTAAVKPERKLALAGDLLTLKIPGRKKGSVEHFVYRIDRLTCELGGHAFRLLRIETPRPETDSGIYDLHLAEDGQASCECKGYLRWHKCKHVDACRVLVTLGRI
jgi:hypothetical protein